MNKHPVNKSSLGTEVFYVRNKFRFTYEHGTLVCHLVSSCHLTCTIIFCFGKTKYFLGSDRSKDHSKRKYFLGLVLVLPKQKIIVQIRLSLLMFQISHDITKYRRVRNSRERLQLNEMRCDAFTESNCHKKLFRGGSIRVLNMCLCVQFHFLPTSLNAKCLQCHTLADACPAHSRTFRIYS